MEPVKALPVEAFLVIEEEGTDDAYLGADSSIERHARLGETRRIGRYRLIETLDVTPQVTAKTVSAGRE